MTDALKMLRFEMWLCADCEKVFPSLIVLFQLSQCLHSQQSSKILGLEFPRNIQEVKKGILHLSRKWEMAFY